LGKTIEATTLNHERGMTLLGCVCVWL
jgi:hypothetical protein